MESDIQIYCNCMANIRDRINVVNSIMSRVIHVGVRGQPELKDQTAELIFLQFRKVLEGIAFATLSANKEKYSEVHANFSKHWRAKAMLEVLDEVNPGFYPIPMPPPVRSGEEVSFGEPLEENIFTREDFIFLYKCSSEILHTHNPYRQGDQTINTKFTVQEWAFRIQRLLACHRTHLLNGEVWVIQIPDGGNVTASRAVPTP